MARRLPLVVSVFALAFAGALLPRVALGQNEAVPPVVTEHVDAERPEGFPDRDVTVVLAVTVDAQGHVTATSVIESGGTAFDDAAIAAVQQWSFRPATRGGAAVAAKIRIPFHFLPVPKRLEDVHRAQPPPPDNKAPATVVPHGGSGDVHVDEVTVYGRTAPPNRGVSDMPIHIGELRRIPRLNASELLKLAPGILLTNEGGDGHAEQVFLRGFDAREGQDIEFSVGGVPINELGNLHANGYADTHFILPELVESLRVVEGPFDPRQGNFAVAGSADYQLGLERRGLTAKGTHGSFGTNRLVLTYGPREASRHTFGGAEYFQTNGFGQNRAAKRASAMAQYEGHLGERGTYRVFAQGYSVNYGSAGLLRADDVGDSSQPAGASSGKKDFYDTYDPNQGGQSTRFSIAADLEHKFDKTTIYQQLFFIMRSMRVQENFTGFLLDVQQPAQTPHPQRGDLIDRSVSTRTIGSRGFARYVDRLLERRQELELGYFVRYDESDSTQYRVASSSRVPYRLDIALAPKIADVGLYADAAIRPIDKVTLRGGVRADFFTFDILNSCAQKSVRQASPSNPPGDASCLSQQNFGLYREPVDRVTTASAAAMPKATLVLGPWSGFNFSASYGRGVRSVDPVYVYQDVKTPFASVTAYETGAEYKRNLTDFTTLQARSIFFGTHVDRDLVFSQTEGRNTLANGTTRSGWVGAVRITGKHFDESAHVTLVRSTFDDTGLLVPYVPDSVARNDLVFHGELPWRFRGSPLRAAAGTGTTFVGRRALPFGQRSGVIFTVDASASVGWRNFDIELSSTNLLDSRYKLGEYNFASNWQQGTSPTLVPARHFAAGAPRAMFLTLTINVGGEKS